MALTILNKLTYIFKTTKVSSANLNEIQDAVIELQQKSVITDAQSLSSAKQQQVRDNIGAGKSTDIGTLSNLDTTAKGNLVAAVNEVNAKCEAVGISDVVEITTPTFNSLPRTFNAAGITADHELVQDGYAYVSVPSAMGADWELDTGAGTVTIRGTFSGSTPASVKATFGIKNKVTATS